MNKAFYFLIIIFFLGNSIKIQGQAPFILNGSAIANDSCYQLTPLVNWQVGSIWNAEKINLNESFKVSVDLFVGCNDTEGADGLVFGLQPVSTSIGMGGGDLGFGNVEPSLGIEFDTYQNLDFSDPFFDHIAIIRDGILNHFTAQGSLAGPVQASADNVNIEDCLFHPMQIIWDADSQTLSIYLDCELRLTYTGDIVNEIFNGDPEVFWGFTSATGGLNNIHEICFSYTSILDDLVDQTICPGTDIQLETGGGTSYTWSPSEGLSDPNIANPIASPLETTLYTVEVVDDCGLSFTDEVLITVENTQFEAEIMGTSMIPTETPPGTEIELNVEPSDGQVYTYVWSSAIGSTFSHSDSSSTIVTSSVSQTGVETILVQVIDEDGCISEASISFEIVGELYEIPNAFTPNGDAINDTFGVITQAQLEEYSCKVFNRWGQIVFETNDPLEPWDGTQNSKTSPVDVYVYIIQLKIGDLSIEAKGDVTLIR